MTGKVFVDLGVSLDGFVAGPNGGPRIPSATAAPGCTSGSTG
jgi:hypothetical protein